MNLSELQARVREVNVANGWRQGVSADSSPLESIGLLGLIMTEVAEAIEEVRNGSGVNPYYTTYYTERGEALSKPEGLPSELADVVIRAFDVADIFGIDLAFFIDEKLSFNAQRGYRHGGKRA